MDSREPALSLPKGRLSPHAALTRQLAVPTRAPDGLLSRWNQENHFDVMSIRSENQEKLRLRPSSKRRRWLVRIDLLPLFHPSRTAHD